jgi:hypothetical protein
VLGIAVLPIEGRQLSGRGRMVHLDKGVHGTPLRKWASNSLFTNGLLVSHI